MAKRRGRIPLVSIFSDAVLPYFPGLEKKLRIAIIEKTTHEFMDWVMFSSFILSLFLTLLIGLIANSLSMSLLWLIPIFVLSYLFSFFYYLNYPDVLMLKARKEIDYEIVFATRHLLIALRSGMPLFDAIVGVSKGYGAVSKEFRKIVDDVTLGKPLSQSLREVSDTSPSSSLKRILLQIANALSSGSDVADSLEVVLNQIAKEQVIALKEYGQKLNPLVMFYMIFGIIFPSLGIAFAIILFSFIGGGLQIPAAYLLLVVFAIGLLQFLFLAMAESSRPKYSVV
ncbi:MAG: type II secretion system F family protein [Candidatus Anstonellales archaeon]